MKLITWLKKPNIEKISSIKYRFSFLSNFIFKLGLSSFNNKYLSYHPDSYTRFNNYDEFNQLIKKFTYNNKKNNSGDLNRLWSFILNIENIIENKVDGDFAELGVWKGNTASVMAHYAHKYKRKMYLCDTFEGFSDKDLTGIDLDKEIEFTDTSLKEVIQLTKEYSDCCKFIEGYFPDSINDELRSNSFSVVSIDCDLYSPMASALKFFYPRMNKGGVFFLHDYSSCHWQGAKKAINEFCNEFDEQIVLMPDKSGSAFLKKTKK
jgi:SAM-dependent methyltransferase